MFNRRSAFIHRLFHFYRRNSKPSVAPANNQNNSKLCKGINDTTGKKILRKQIVQNIANVTSNRNTAMYKTKNAPKTEKLIIHGKCHSLFTTFILWPHRKKLLFSWTTSCILCTIFSTTERNMAPRYLCSVVF